MNGQEQLERLKTSLLNLGARRLAALALVGVTVFTAVALGSYYLSRPSLETLYVGLAQQDAMRVGAVLREAGIDFDISADGAQLMVPYGQTAQARMLLAERGLPSSATSGYELFDKLGPVGLTSFMQDITRVRALEGEIARTVQTMKGVKAARVHLVMPDEGSFRRNRQPPSASVIVRTDGAGPFTGASAIRHLVAAAVPALTPDQVTVLNTDGAVLAAGGETLDTAPHKMVELEKVVSDELQDNVRKTLIPYLGLNNFEISVTARLNLDKREINETTYDPESRVERSVRNVKESSSSQNAGNSANVTVEQNIPAEQTAAIPGESSKSQKDRREELSNFELNTKKISTVSNGYKIENLTVAVVLNKRQLLASLGQNPSQDAIDKQIKEVEKVVETAAGLDPARGDRVTVAAVDFIVDTERLDPVPSPDIVDMLMRQMGSFVNAITIVAGIALLIWFGLRPAVRAILEQPQPEGFPAGQTPAIEGQAQGAPPSLPGPALALQEEEEEFALPRPRKTTPQQRLEAIVEANEEAVAAMLKQLLRG
jgi:flagellar M-ring protein FliF